ncbi:Acyl-CoA Delta(11) desaturase [Blattella germanica]|nr:Acyl-CoA Delta(11) desaturase [Blattella germanica]
MTATKKQQLQDDIKEPQTLDTKWFNVIFLTVSHIVGLYGLKVWFIDAKLYTILWIFAVAFFSGFGVTAGAHRLWTHRSFKAKLPLRILLVFMYCTSGMNSLFEWVRDHRVHHRFSETDADPHNAKRGLFFSHVGWLMQKKHPEVKRRGKEVDMSDITSDPVIIYEEKFFIPLYFLCCYIIPTWVPYHFWGEYFWTSFLANVGRWVLCLNFVWSVNSFAHIYGFRPYNRNINPAENKLVSIVALGEGWHNYHHTFPWDYKTGEFGFYGTNFTTALIDFFASIGWAYDLKVPSKEVVQQTIKKSGDGSYQYNLECLEELNSKEEKEKGIATIQFSGFGVTAGAHRLWTHRSYKAKLPLRILLAIMYCTAGLVSISSLTEVHNLVVKYVYNSLYDWVRDHKVHHRFSETEADPHNAKRGLFFSHCGWLMQKKHPEVKRRGKEVDMSDITSDPVITYEEMFFRPLYVLCCFVIPTWIPWHFWSETLWNAYFCNITRWVIGLNFILSVNSFAHTFGYRPYNR